MAEEKTVTIQLVKSPFGRKPNQGATLRALGLTRTQRSVTVKDTPAVRGMIATVAHLVIVK